MALVRILARFYDPNVVAFLAVSLLLGSCLLVALSESVEFSVVEARLNVERHWERMERILAQRLVVKSHIQEQCLLIREVPVILNFVVNLLREGRHLRLEHRVRHVRLRIHLTRRLARLLRNFRRCGRQLELSLESPHNIDLAALRPQHIRLVFFVVEQPPVAHFEKRPDQHRIVALSNVDLIRW